MAKKIMQFRYYGEKNVKNQPSTISKAKLTNGSAFLGYLPITRLDIKSPEGTKFFLNGSSTSIVIGSSGTYNLDIEGITEINRIFFDSNSIENINKNENASLIIDVICEEK